MYRSSERLQKQVLEAIMAPIPYLVSIPIRAIPQSLKLSLIGGALNLIVPSVLASFASTQTKGKKQTLTANGVLHPVLNSMFVRSVASYLIPTEVADLTDCFNEDLKRLAEQDFTQFNYKLVLEDGVAVLETINDGFVNSTYSSVVEMLSAKLNLKFWK